MSAATHAIRYPVTPPDFTWSCCSRAEHLDGGAVSSQFRDRLETGGSRRPALEPVSVNAVGAGSGWHGRYPPGRKAICIPGRPRLEEHGGMGARPKGVRFLCAVAARAEWI